MDRENKIAMLIGIAIVIVCVVLGIVFSNNSLNSYDTYDNTYTDTKSAKEKIIEVLENRGYTPDKEYYNVYVRVEKHNNSGLDILVVQEINFNNKTMSYTFIINDNGSIVYGRESYYTWSNNFRKANVTEYSYQNGSQYIQYSVNAYYDNANMFICDGNTNLCNELSNDINNVKNDFLSIISEANVSVYDI